MCVWLVVYFYSDAGSALGFDFRAAAMAAFALPTETRTGDKSSRLYTAVAWVFWWPKLLPMMSRGS
jgi:hypothetical protein